MSTDGGGFYLNESDAEKIKQDHSIVSGQRRIPQTAQRRARRSMGGAAPSGDIALQFGVITERLIASTGTDSDEWGEGKAQMYDGNGAESGDEVTVRNRSADAISVGIPCWFSNNILVVPYCFPLPISSGTGTSST